MMRQKRAQALKADKHLGETEEVEGYIKVKGAKETKVEDVSFTTKKKKVKKKEK